MLVIGNINENARDPHIVYYNGKYYMTYSYEDKLFIKYASSLELLKDAKGEVVYTPDKNDEYKVNIWAPELHIINDVCYIYVTIGSCVNSVMEHMFVLCNNSNDPLKEYKNVAYLNNGDDGWAIDGSLIKINNELYYAYSSMGKAYDLTFQNLYIVKMKSPTEIEGPRHLLSRATYPWELYGANGMGRPFVNEGPFAVYHNGLVKVVYSASGCWTNNYCLAVLTYKGSGDPLDRKNWIKEDEPIFSKKDGYLGPGHACFIQNDPSGTEYIVFHAYDDDCIYGQKYVSGYVLPIKWVDNNIKVVLDK